MDDMRCFLMNIRKEIVVEPDYGDLKLQVFPVDSREKISLPLSFQIWNEQIQSIIDIIPFQETAYMHYVTIDTRFFCEDGYLRGEGVHIDGNFCYDPTFIIDGCFCPTWAGLCVHKKGHLIKSFETPYEGMEGFCIPMGKFVSENKGGILMVSSDEGCSVWHGVLPNAVRHKGEYPEKYLGDVEEEILDKNRLYFMSSNTPHKSNLTAKGVRRTLVRVTLNHNYDNRPFYNMYVNNKFK